VVLVLSKLNWVVHLETTLVVCMGFYFIHQIFVEFQRLCDVLLEKKNKLFTNVKTRWINMLILVKHVMEKYRPLIAKMHIDAPKNNIVNDKLNLFCFLKLIFGFRCN
jgi:hypothetical protein